MLRVLLVLVVAGACASASPTLVNTPAGPIQGVSADGVTKFLGIPFAEPPVGSLRWAAPVKYPVSQEVINATSFQAGCPQKCDLPPGTCPETISEDCLYLDVYVPPGASAGEKLPVMFFMPGGRFEQGSIATYLYDGAHWANSSRVIVVNTAYRLGALGWLVTDGDIGGNFGYMDQVMALEWVQTNIASFGGDADNVMLFGQSAGGTSTAVHLTADNADESNLFAKAVMQSNPFSLIMKPTALAQKTGTNFADAVGCKSTDSACLRSKSMAEVIAGQIAAQQKIDYLKFITAFYPWTPTVDNKLFSMQPIDAFRAGKFRKVPVMLGSMYNDALLFIWQAWNHTLPKIEYELLMADAFHLRAIDVLAEYPGTSGDNRFILAHMVTQWLFACPARATARAFADAGLPTYLYQMHHALSFDAWGEEYWYCRKGAVKSEYSGEETTCHGTELPLEFLAPQVQAMVTPAELELGKTWAAYWASFAATSDPNKLANLDLHWPAYDATSNANLLFATPSSVATDLWAAQCDKWDKWGYMFDV